jgi:tRNA threonylcarbamoyladenosine biosynthesis protein TsaB
MLILAVDTSGKNGSLALVRFRGTVQHTLDIVPIEGGTFSAQLVLQIAALLERYHLSKNEIDAFAVVSGPGSFTGLRVGLAAIKALAEVLHKPIVALSLLEAVAVADSRVPGRVVSALDAGRGDIYSGVFELERTHATCISQELRTLDEFVANKDVERIVTFDEKLAQILADVKLQVTLVPRPTAAAIAWLGFEKIGEGETVSPEALDALYIRRSDAEIKLSK